MRKMITDKVNTHPGVTSVELVLALMGIVGPSQFNEDEFAIELKNLIETKEIVELEYVSPLMLYRVKSLYFPKGTSFKFQ